MQLITRGGRIEMDKNTEEKMFQMHAEVCKSMANPTRLKIMNLLRDGERSVEELKKRLGLPKANLSQHLSVLRHRRIVSTRRAGLNIYYKVANPKMIKACDILRDVLFAQLQGGEKLARGVTERRKNLRRREMLSRLTELVTRFPKTTIAVFLIVTVFFGLQFPKMKIDTDPENMLESSQPDRVFYDKVKKEFGIHDLLVVGIVDEG